MTVHSPTDASPPTPPATPKVPLWRLWFGFRAPVSRRDYLLSGLVLVVVKYLGDSSILLRTSGDWWTPIEYLSPFFAHRIPALGDAAPVAVLAVWSLPFIWIGASMTARRARDAGMSPLIAILFFIPLLNYGLMLSLCLAPSGDRAPSRDADEAGSFADLLAAVIAGAAAGGLVLAAAFLGSVESRYGLGLFAGAPFTMGLVTAFLASRRRRPAKVVHATAQLGLVAGAGSLLLFGIEGALCIAMAYPLAVPLTAVGGLLGRALALPRRFATSHLLVVVALAPWMTALDRTPQPPLREIVTTIEIDAPPEAVWPYIVDFAELPPPGELAFRFGVAYPMRAWIEGRGAGAVRYCEFSTGSFVEPITRWEEPYRLSFDVASQPPTMQEWSPWKIHPAHLTESLVSERGEFRLIPLPGGGTRLEGSTWYRHDLFPQIYWNLWSDALIHGIHRRVLRSIATRSEANGGLSAEPARL